MMFITNTENRPAVVLIDCLHDAIRIIFTYRLVMHLRGITFQHELDARNTDTQLVSRLVFAQNPVSQYEGILSEVESIGTPGGGFRAGGSDVELVESKGYSMQTGIEGNEEDWHSPQPNDGKIMDQRHV